MAITSFNALGLGRETRRASFSDGRWTVVEVFEMITDDTLEDIQANAANLTDPIFFETDSDPKFPARWSAHPANGSLFLDRVVSVTSNPDDYNRWIVELEYTSAVPGTGSIDFEVDGNYQPGLKAVTWSFSTTTRERNPSPVNDGHGFTTQSHPVQTTLGEPIKATQTQYIPQASYTRHETSLTSSVLALIGSTNSAAVTIDGIAVAARQGLLQNINIGQLQYDQGTVYRTVTYQIALNNDTWDDYILNRGVFVNVDQDGVQGDRQRAMVKDWDPDNPSGYEPTLTPVNLKYSSNLAVGTADQKLADSKTETYTEAEALAGTHHMRRYMHHYQADWSVLNFT